MDLSKNMNSNSILSSVLPSYNDMKAKLKITNDIPLMTNINANLEKIPMFEFEEVTSIKNKKKEDIKVVKNTSIMKKEEAAKTSKKTTTIDHSLNYVTVYEYNRQNLEKLKIDNFEEVKSDIVEYYGTLKYYNTELDKINILNSIPLNIEPSETNDQFRFYSNASIENDKNLTGITVINVYASDKVISTIMTMYLNSRPWHINIKKIEDRLYFDIDENSGLYYSTISESEHLADDEDINNINNEFNLSREGYLINNYLRQKALGDRIEDEFLKNFQAFPFTD